MPDDLERRTRSLERRNRKQSEREADARLRDDLRTVMAVHDRLFHGRPEPGDIVRAINLRARFDDLDSKLRTADGHYWARLYRQPSQVDQQQDPKWCFFEIVSYPPEELVPVCLIDGLRAVSRVGGTPPAVDRSGARERWVHAQYAVNELGDHEGMALRAELVRRREQRSTLLIDPGELAWASRDGERLVYEFGFVETDHQQEERRALLIAANQIYLKRMRGENVEVRSNQDLVNLVLSHPPGEEIPQWLQVRFEDIHNARRSPDPTVQEEYVRMSPWIEEFFGEEWAKPRRVHLSYVRSTSPPSLIPSDLAETATTSGGRGGS